MQRGGGQTYLRSPIHHILSYNTSDLLGSHRRKNKNVLLLQDIPMQPETLDICLGAVIGFLMLLEKLNDTIEKNVNSFLKLCIRIFIISTSKLLAVFTGTCKQITPHQTYMPVKIRNI